jgi:hypothetical protein
MFCGPFIRAHNHTLRTPLVCSPCPFLSAGDYVHSACHRFLLLQDEAAAQWAPAVGSSSSSISGGPPPAAPKLRRELTARSQAALTAFEDAQSDHGGSQSGGDHGGGGASSWLRGGAAGAALDVTTAEELLLRGAAKLNETTRKQLRAAVAAGDLGLAGMLLLGGTLAQAGEPRAPAGGSSSSSSSGSGADGGDRGGGGAAIKCAVCFDSVRGAPGGLVSCLSGHALHASCAADLLLSGGACPECREPLFYARVELGYSEADATAAPTAASAGSSTNASTHAAGAAAAAAGADASAATASAAVVVKDAGAPMRQGASGRFYCGQLVPSAEVAATVARRLAAADAVAGRVVVLTNDFASHGDASSGPLRPKARADILSMNGNKAAGAAGAGAAAAAAAAAHSFLLRRARPRTSAPLF